jgi:hypothetical protein
MFRFPRAEVHRLLDDAGEQGKVLEEKEMEICVFRVPLAEASVNPVASHRQENQKSWKECQKAGEDNKDRRHSVPSKHLEHK